MLITIKDLEYRYQVRTPFERLALYNVNLSVKRGTFQSIIGHTGSGKSTVLQHLNGLLKPSKGSIQIGDYLIDSSRKFKNLRDIRHLVGIVFQFPEHQLFEETVEKDIAFGPINFGMSEEKAILKAREVLGTVGLPETILYKSPFDLSGGQMRRVAIAGVLAMEPQILVLDEPTAGLDPKGKKEMMRLFHKLYKEKGLTIILVTHSMEDAARYSDHIIVMNKGTIEMQGSPREIFRQADKLTDLGLDLPETVKLSVELQNRGFPLREIPLTIEDSIKQIKESLLGVRQG